MATDAELRLLEGVFRDFRELEKEGGKFVEQLPRLVEIRASWRFRLLQTMEFWCFLVNHEHVKDPSLVSFFHQAVMGWYDTILMAVADDDDRKSTTWAEIKRYVATGGPSASTPWHTDEPPKDGTRIVGFWAGILPIIPRIGKWGDAEGSALAGWQIGGARHSSDPTKWVYMPKDG